ncbi:MAG: peptidylprolyl isomerase [Clostridia bacterium]|nr:peptidylprolyl isomerase [Clostridia bacterium]
MSRTGFRPAFSLLLAVLLLAGVCLTGCSSDRSPAVMTFRGTTVSENLFRYWMASYKAYFLHLVGGQDSDAWLNGEWSVSNEDGSVVSMTAGEYLQERILGVIRSNLISLRLFEEYGLSLPDSARRDVEVLIESEIENAGSRRALNEKLAAIGITIDQLREFKLAEEKINCVYSYLYGETANGVTVSSGAEPISEEQYDAFYQAHYVLVKHIYIRTKDRNVLDADGNVQYTSSGTVLTEPLSEEESAQKYALCDSLMELLSGGADFDELMQEYSEDAGRRNYPNGYIVSRSSSLPEEFLENAFDMQIGELRRVDASYATHIMIREPLPERGWEDENWKGFLGSIQEYVTSEVFAEKIAPMILEIVCDEDRVSENSIFLVPAVDY